MTRLITFLCSLGALAMLSGCCEIFGVCTSVAVHTSIQSPQTFSLRDDTPTVMTLADEPTPYSASTQCAEARD